MSKPSGFIHASLRQPQGILRGLATVALALLASIATAGTPEPLHVATYNLRLDTPVDGRNAWAQRRDAVKALIRYHRFDLFGTQEGLPNQITDLEALTEYAHVGVGRDDGQQAGEHSAIFYRRARFDLLAHGDFWFSPTPQVPSKGWDAHCCNRLASWVRLRDTRSGSTLTVVSVHFDHEGQVARRESANLLLQWLAKQDSSDALIALGDFNSTPDTIQIQRMQASLRDARAVSETPPYGPTETFNNFAIGKAPEARIDYIFLGPRIRVLDYGVLTDSNGERYPSDHFPVVASLLIE
ncbi:endonuclease/exonuclease/phosphatase family protein [Thermomonas beijingensis]|uniref:Endonuclease/exonuclease/phosphatase family protein n=1 Tax=Thermomonas beijingensis TaxID=2872701 RepID=A0ABS7TEJ3_9GAMM|nr:endonuclease/exonuclease/phosphatase family protein [Thermomonas beijingensis]MBS0460715.1 endonuclease/exonuclease/phosphatase family protein [Pseudomonadota bacterium]MBZ4186274.1 endonuclease/exonuclease/phosphatase family protein [Thermomonas beijingensis]